MNSTKGVGGSLAILGTGTVISLVLGAIQGAITARVLGLADFGRYASLIAFAALIGKVNEFGLPHAFSYFHRRSPEVLPKLLRLLGINFCWCMLTAAVILVVITHVPLPFAPVGSLSPWALVAYGTLIAVGTPLAILASTVIATGNYKFFAVLNCATSLIQICLILLFALLGSISLQVVVGIAALASFLVTTVVTVFFVRRARHAVATSIGMREVISFGLHLHWGVLIKQISSRCELLFVASVLAPAQTGLFSLALSVRDAALAPQGIYTAPLQNLIIDRNKPDGLVDDRSAIMVSLFLQLIFATALSICAACALPFLIPLLYGQEFRAAIGPALVLVASTIFVGASSICFIAFNAKGRPNFTSLIQAAVGIPLPFVIYFMAQAFGIYGASLAALLMAAVGFALSFGVIARMQRYTAADVKTGLLRTPHFLFVILSNMLMQLIPSRLVSKGRR